MSTLYYVFHLCWVRVQNELELLPVASLYSLILISKTNTKPTWAVFCQRLSRLTVIQMLGSHYYFKSKYLTNLFQNKWESKHWDLVFLNFKVDLRKILIGIIKSQRFRPKPNFNYKLIMEGWYSKLGSTTQFDLKRTDLLFVNLKYSRFRPKQQSLT